MTSTIDLEKLHKIKLHEHSQIRNHAQERRKNEGMEKFKQDMFCNLTAMEHKLIDSSWPGKAYHPNFPVAIAGGSTIDEVNAAREQINKRKAYWICVETEDKQTIILLVRLLPLTEDQIENPEPEITFEIYGATDNHRRGFIHINTEISHGLLHQMFTAQDEERQMLLDKLHPTL